MTDEELHEGERDIARMTRERERLDREGMYRISDERDSCGVGLIAAIDGQARRDVVTMAIRALKSLWHRGAVDADGKTGDGAGIMIDVPQDFFHDVVRRTGHTPLAGASLRRPGVLCRASISPARKRRAASSNPKSCAPVFTFMAGARCRWMYR